MNIKQATIIDSTNFPKSIQVEIFGENNFMTVVLVTELFLEESEVLEVIEYHSASGYATYLCDVETLKDTRFYANIGFSREGQDWAIEYLEDNNLEVEAQTPEVEKQTLEQFLGQELRNILK